MPVESPPSKWTCRLDNCQSLAQNPSTRGWLVFGPCLVVFVFHIKAVGRQAGIQPRGHVGDYTNKDRDGQRL